ncbi:MULTISPECIES: hypothetical protein [Pseudomonas]|uniref:Uncharacterized protein n=1 Tax=Pseudomonas alkylphenolica TaxID=237609 RepID=A0A443ZW10_9PSED|nr:MULTISPECIES: hypothetical protein [Pseudomonas]NWL22162.1 hypothetical protein [Pseudomonas umsongensis]RWU25000.1 hypothetical protein DM813_04475 [Pseudomonas alkylphenolica]
MKLFTLDKTILMDLSTVTPHDQGILIEGKIMGTMPMKVVLRPEELRTGLKLISPRLIFALLAMLFRKSSQQKK